MSAYSKMLAIIVLLIAVFYTTNVYHAAKQDQITQTFIERSTNDFITSVKLQGKVTLEQYFKFLDDLASTGVLFTVKLEHSHKSYDPVYDDAGNFTEDVTLNEYMFFNEEILENLEVNGVYLMSKGDSFSIKVYNSSPTLYDRMRFSKGNYGEFSIAYFDGGMILDENY